MTGDVLLRLRLTDPSLDEEGPWLSLFSRKDEPRPSANLARGTVILVRAVKVRRFEEPACPTKSKSTAWNRSSGIITAFQSSVPHMQTGHTACSLSRQAIRQSLRWAVTGGNRPALA